MSTTEVFSLGVEEEYQIVDPTSRELDSIAEEIVQEAQKRWARMYNSKFSCRRSRSQLPYARAWPKSEISLRVCVARS